MGLLILRLSIHSSEPDNAEMNLSVELPQESSRPLGLLSTYLYFLVCFPCHQSNVESSRPYSCDKTDYVDWDF
jgi:hypothetical protein